MGNKNQLRFIQLLKTCSRPGIQELINYLENETDFFTAPASTKYHGCHEQGLLEHSLNVFDELSKMPYSKGIDTESIILCSLLHDVCKANFYTVSYRNAKNEQGIWEKVPYYTVKDELPYGHGEKSVYMISKFIKLTDEEAMAIRWHMGSFDAGGNAYTLSTAMEKYPLIIYLHLADLIATHIKEN